MRLLGRGEKTSRTRIGKTRDIVKGTYNDPFEIDDSLVGLDIVIQNRVCQLRYIVSCIALTRNVEFPLFILWKSLKPVQQENIVVVRRSSVATCHEITGRVRVREPHSSWRFQEQHIRS